MHFMIRNEQHDSDANSAASYYVTLVQKIEVMTPEFLTFIITFIILIIIIIIIIISSMRHCECVAPNVDIILHSRRF